jgi:hypothetical protein
MEHWHVVEWGLDAKQNVYIMVLGMPIVETVEVTSPDGGVLLDQDGQPVTQERVVGFERLQNIVFSADEKTYTHHAGKKLRDEKILERHMKAVAKAFALTEPPADEEESTVQVRFDAERLPDLAGRGVADQQVDRE